MTKMQRITNILFGLLMILASVVMFAIPQLGYVLILMILAISMIIYGIRQIIYFIAMARHMVGGKTQLVRGVIALDFGMFTLTLLSVPRIYILVYLLISYAVIGAVSVLRGLEARKYDAPFWVGKIIYGAIHLAVAVASLIFIRSVNLLVFFYSAGLFYSACVRIISSFRRTAIVYVQ